jgi:hypothetical protein
MTESPKYFVVQKSGDIEIRQYAGYIKAEVEISDENYKSAAEKGFSILAGYIFGNNISKQKIDMTTPVQAVQSQKIAMTTPVTVSESDNFKVAFIMPSIFTLETLPLPKDNRIQFTPIPENQMAAIRFSGYFQQKKIKQKMEQLRSWLEDQGLETEGDFIVAGYNPPWVPGFIARNEVMIHIRNIEQNS